jgi:8-oxo-dGTP diphosphatase
VFRGSELPETKLIVAPPSYKFCPFCAASLQSRLDRDQMRPFCANCNWTYYAHMAISVTGILVDGERALLVKRRHEPFPGTWMFPSGFVEYGEHPVDALLREFLEETGLRAEHPTWLGLYQSDDDPREPGHIALFYEIPRWHGSLRNDPIENDGVDWFELQNPPVVELKHHALFIDLYRKRLETEGA